MKGVVLENETAKCINCWQNSRFWRELCQNIKKLTIEEIKHIADKMLKNLKERLNNLNVSIEFTDAVITTLAEKGFDSSYGARPLRREIQNQIEDALSEKILDASIKNGDSVICDYTNDEFVFSVK